MTSYYDPAARVFEPNPHSVAGITRTLRREIWPNVLPVGIPHQAAEDDLAFYWLVRTRPARFWARVWWVLEIARYLWVGRNWTIRSARIARSP